MAKGSRRFVILALVLLASGVAMAEDRGVGGAAAAVRVAKDGYLPLQQDVTIRAGQWTQVLFDLEPIPVEPSPPPLLAAQPYPAREQSVVPPSAGQAPTKPSPDTSAQDRLQAGPQTAWPAGQTRSVDLGGGVMLEMVWIPPGTFTMGSPSSEQGRRDDERQHQVTLTKGFWLGKYEVTQEQWERVMGSNPSSFKGAKNPVEQVFWEDAQAFCEKAGNGLRLPTEAEWEYACRAGTTTARYWGDSDDAGRGYANAADSSAKRENPSWTCFSWDDGYVHTSLVGRFKPNAFGLYDIIGNVSEWCQDRYGDYSSGSATDPTGAASGSRRVNRGGGWRSSSRDCRSAGRIGRSPGNRINSLGFRAAASPAVR